MKTAYRFRIAIVLGTLVCASLAQGGSLTLAFNGANCITTPNQQDCWTATFPNSVTVTGTATTLVKTVTFTDLNPISITFTENATATADNFGFRVTMSESVTNNSGVSWTGFNETLVDGNPSLTSSSCATSSAHPCIAHFHQDPGFSGAPFTLTGGGSSQNSLQFGNSTIANGVTWNPAGIGIHEWELNGSLRSFTLVETPVGLTASVPEPGTAFLLMLGGVLFAGFRRSINRLQ